MPDPLPPDTTIAELAGQGYTHLEIRCGCKLTHYPIQMLKGDPKRLTLAELQRRLRCEDCLKTPTPGSLRGWRQEDASGYVRTYERR